MEGRVVNSVNHPSSIFSSILIIDIFIGVYPELFIDGGESTEDLRGFDQIGVDVTNDDVGMDGGRVDGNQGRGQISDARRQHLRGRKVGSQLQCLLFKGRTERRTGRRERKKEKERKKHKTRRRRRRRRRRKPQFSPWHACDPLSISFCRSQWRYAQLQL